VQAMSKAKTTVRNIFNISLSSGDFPMHMKNFLRSGTIDSWPAAIRAYSAAVSFKERQDVAKAALNVIASITKYRDELIRKELIEVPDLYNSIANLCNEELLIQVESQDMLNDIFQIVNTMPLQANASMKSLWADVLVRCLQDSLDSPYLVLRHMKELVVRLEMCLSCLSKLLKKKCRKKQSSVETKVNNGA